MIFFGLAFMCLFALAMEYVMEFMEYKYKTYIELRDYKRKMIFELKKRKIQEKYGSSDEEFYRRPERKF